MRAFCTVFLLCASIAACDRTNSARLQPISALAEREFAFDDTSPGSPGVDTLLRVNASVASTSANGAEADLLLTYTVDPSIRGSLKPDSFVKFEYVAPNKPGFLVARASINDELGGTVEATVPTNDIDAKLVATIGGLQPGVIDNQGILVAQLPAVAKRETTDLSRVQAVNAELVDGSYESMVVEGRRLHRFAIKVTDPTAGPISDLLTEQDNTAVPEYSISGLENDATKHFVAIENDSVDIESAINVEFTEFPLAVYLVIDASKSIVDSGQAHHLSNAVSNTVIALSQNAAIDYRSFNGSVTRINGLRELDFDSSDVSATALYHAIDTALSDIENYSSIDQDKVIMVFTDGKDRASRNHYSDDFIDNDQVHDYVVQRVSQVRSAQQDFLGRQLNVYTIGFYGQDSNLDELEEIRKLDRIAEVGGTIRSYNNLNAADIDEAFAAVVHNVRGVYYLQYNSQQTSSNNKLELLVKVNGHESRVQLPTQYNQ